MRAASGLEASEAVLGLTARATGAATVVLLLLVALVTACAGGGEPSEIGAMCSAVEIPNEKHTHVPRPDEHDATFSFPGNMPEQREYVFLHGDGSYDYVERWDVGIPNDLDLEVEVGWDWKVGCRIHVCPLPSGGACCHQVCRDGGHSGMSWEPPEAFSCMNSAAGGEYDWFIEGLRSGGMDELDACEAAQEPS